MTTNPTRDTLMKRMKLCYELMQLAYQNDTGEKLVKHRSKEDFDKWLSQIEKGLITLTAERQGDSEMNTLKVEVKGNVEHGRKLQPGNVVYEWWSNQDSVLAGEERHVNFKTKSEAIEYINDFSK